MSDMTDSHEADAMDEYLRTEDRRSIDEIKQMTDAELVEAVAREVMGWESTTDYDGISTIWWHGEERVGVFHPLADMNDLFMVLERFSAWAVSYDVTGKVKNQPPDLTAGEFNRGE